MFFSGDQIVFQASLFFGGQMAGGAALNSWTMTLFLWETQPAVSAAFREVEVCPSIDPFIILIH